MILLNIQSGELTDDDFTRMIERANELSKRNLYIDDKCVMLSDIKALCRKQKLQKGLDVVVIDYLQLIRTDMKGVMREQEVSYISRELKSLAKELQITIIALSQLSRAPEARADHRPMLSDLRESGSIEQDADVIHFIYRDSYYNNPEKQVPFYNNTGFEGKTYSGQYNGKNNLKSSQSGVGRYNSESTVKNNIAEIITAKNRNGKTTTNELYWIGEYQRFTSANVFE